MHTLAPNNNPNNNDAHRHNIHVLQYSNSKDAHNNKEIKYNLNHVDDAEPSSHWNIFKSAPPKRRNAIIANEQVTLPKYAAPPDPPGATTNSNLVSTTPQHDARKLREQDSTSSITREHNTTIEQAQETLDPESPCYIQEILDSWNQVNHVKPRTFQRKKLSGLDASLNNEIWIKTKSNNIDIEWIADTGSPKSFVNEETAKAILQNSNKPDSHTTKTQKYTGASTMYPFQALGYSNWTSHQATGLRRKTKF